MANRQEPVEITEIYKSLPLDPDLEQIRTVTIEPGDKNDPIVLTLKRRALPEAEYTALSYMWAYKPPGGRRQEPRTEIRSEVGLHAASHKVGSNLYAALHQLRHPEHPQDYWIDAICLDQQDDKEKTVQLKLMGKIYSRAQKTVVWLGKETARSSRSSNGFAAIRWFHLLIRNRLDSNNRILRQAPQVPSANYKAYATGAEVQRYLSGLMWLLQNPYFSRVWIIQEVILSPNLEFQLGPDCVSMEQFETAVGLFSTGEVASQNSRTLNNILAIRSHVRGRPRASPENMSSLFEKRFSDKIDLEDGLFSLLLLSRRSDCSEKVDKVFALLGLCRELENAQTFGIDEDCKPEGQKENVHIQVYIKVAVSILKAKQDLGLFAALGLKPDGGRMAMLPSWVPDWSDTQHFAAPIGTRSCDVAVTGNSKFEYDEENSHDNLLPEILILSGYEIDQINRTGPPCNTERSKPNVWLCRLSFSNFPATHRLQTLANWWAKFGRESSISEEFDATVTCGLASNYPAVSATKLARRFQITGLEDLQIHYKLLGIFLLTILCAKSNWVAFFITPFECLAVLLVVLTVNLMYNYVALWKWPYMVTHLLDNNEADLCNDGLARMEGRTIAMTKGGSLALVPEFSREGDIIAVCKGGRLPLVFRKVPNSGELQIVGECYIYKVMSGKEGYDESRCVRLFVV